MPTQTVNGKTKAMGTWQVPNRLKKKLQSSMENLSAKEAGRLYLILTHEARKKGIEAGDYPAVRELNAAMMKRVDKARGKPEEAEAVDRYNGYILLQRIAFTANDVAIEQYTELGLQATRSGYVLEAIIRQDQLGLVARQIQTFMVENTPSAITPDEAEAVKRYDSEEGFLDLDELFGDVVDIWTEAQGFKSLDIPYPFLAQGDVVGAVTKGLEHFDTIAKRQWNPDVRRAYIESLDKATIEEYFDDDLAVERWILDTESNWTNFTPEEEEAKFEEVDAFFEELAEADRLDIWPGIFLVGATYHVVPVVDGKIPAWVALREVWSPWLYGQGFQFEESSAAAEFAPDFISRIYDPEGEEVGFDDVVDLAKAFYVDCRRRSWGKGLTNPNDVDFSNLAEVLLQDCSVVLDATAPDYGVVEWAVFEEENGVVDSAERRVARIKDLRAVVGDLERLGIPADKVVERLRIGSKDYYVSEDALRHRRSKKTVVAMLERLRPNRAPFHFNVKPGEDPVRMVDEFFPVDVSTELDRETRIIRDLIRQYKTLRQATTVIADTYFDGIPVIIDKLAQSREEFVDVMTKATVEMLEDWVERLREWPWKVDASPLLIGDIESEDDTVEKIVDHIIDKARESSRVDEPEARLFR